jgi:ADP-heptose:LPS heptosyltransferase
MSLQLPRRPDEIAALPPGVVLDDPMDPAQDFAATAALIDTLDLVISVDTSTAHLAAAMAKPVWLLHRPNLDWRWLHGRTDSPWYPALRLFSQPSPGDWPSVVAAVGRALDGFVRRSAHDRVT